MTNRISRFHPEPSRGIIGVVLVLAIFAGAWSTGESAKKRLMEQTPAPGQMVDVGGFKMHIHCTGQGSLTVVLVSGLDDFSIAWAEVQPEIAKTTRVCSYDRAGLGWSEPSPDPRTSVNMVRELHTLLVNAHVAPPYVIVGHSFGGALAQLYAHSYPSEAVGLVLVDAAPTQLFLRIPSWRNAIGGKIYMLRALAALSASGLLALAPSSIPNRGFPAQVLAPYRAVSAATGYYATCIAENRLFESNLAEIDDAHISSLGALPLVVLSRGRWDPMPGLSNVENVQARQAWAEMQRGLLALSSRSKQVIAANSEHFIQLQQPQVVVDAIQDVVKESR